MLEINIRDITLTGNSHKFEANIQGGNTTVLTTDELTEILDSYDEDELIVVYATPAIVHKLGEMMRRKDGIGRKIAERLLGDCETVVAMTGRSWLQ